MILGIDTSTKHCGAALVSGEELVAESRLLSGLAHAERLPLIVREMMANATVSPDQITGIGVSIGPGSFTGLRIGLGFAKGLALGWNKPLYAVPTMEAVLTGLPEVFDRICVLLTARKDEVYRGLFIKRDVYKAVSEIETLETNQALDGLPEGHWVLTGDGAPSVFDGAPPDSPVTLLGQPWLYPTGLGVARSAQQMARRGETSAADSLAPVYIKRFKGVA